MSTVHQGMSPDEIALLEGDDLDETGAPKEDAADRAASVATADNNSGDADEAAEADALAAAASAQAAAKATPAPPPAAPAASQAAQEPAPAPRYDVAAQADIDNQLAALDQKQADAFKRLMDGEEGMDADAYAAVLREVKAQERQLIAQQTLNEANTQRELQAQVATIEGIKAQGAKVGIDYDNDPGLGALFDAKMNHLAAKPENAGKTFHQLANDVHADVLKMMGKAPAVAAPATASAPATRQPVDMSVLPPTLSRVPPAADPSIAGDEFAHLSSLSGSDLEKAVARLTPDQQERWLN